MTDDSATDDFIAAIIRASERGIKIDMAVDIFTFGEFGGHFTPLKFFTKQSKRTRLMVKKLKKAGIHFTWLGKFSISPLTGRNHMKCLIVDDVVFSFGGINMDSDSMSYVDYMFRVNNADTATLLSEAIEHITEADKKHFSYKSRSFTLDQQTEMLVDGGLQIDSIIYRRACQLIKDAESIIFVSQYCPSGKLSKLLNKTKSRIYFNQPQYANNTANAMAIRLNMFLSGNKTLYSKKQYLHAKFIIATMKDGSKIAITGSHNFTHASVILGTREIAIETKNPQVIRQLEEFFEHSVV